MPTVGQPAPPLAGLTPQGAFDLAAHRGTHVVVYFYPKDLTPGCTTESCDFRDRIDAFTAAGAVVVGVSRDSVKSHARFAEKHALPFPLVSDEDGAITEAWGVWREKQNYGKTYMGIVRSTFVVAPDGTVAAAWDGVKVKGHADAVLRAITG
ncbi:peroxiredoxin [Myxococcota bacterium]|nr:peroxiredoxin [Myxococcota bacterium]